VSLQSTSLHRAAKYRPDGNTPYCSVWAGLAYGVPDSLMGCMTCSGQPNLSKCFPWQDALQSKLLTSLCCVKGTFAVISIIVGNVCHELAPESDFQYFNYTTNETSVNTTAMEAARLEISATLACLTAIIQVRTLHCLCCVPCPKLTPRDSSSLEQRRGLGADAGSGPTGAGPFLTTPCLSHPSCAWDSCSLALLLSTCQSLSSGAS